MAGFNQVTWNESMVETLRRSPATAMFRMAREPVKIHYWLVGQTTYTVARLIGYSGQERLLAIEHFTDDGQPDDVRLIPLSSLSCISPVMT